jgi:putative ABC transport system substrate-binding protein
VDVLLAVTRPAALAAQRATASIPVVLVLVSEPMEPGLVESIRRPGGTISGIGLNFQCTTAKRLQLFIEAFGLYPYPVRDQVLDSISSAAAGAVSVT